MLGKKSSKTQAYLINGNFIGIIDTPKVLVTHDKKKLETLFFSFTKNQSENTKNYFYKHEIH